MLINLTDDNFEMIRQWRNQPQVRDFSFNDHIIDKQEHLNWWQKTKADPSKKWMIYRPQGKYVGVVYYCDIKPKNEAFWGFYFAPDLEDYEKLKRWFALEQCAINYAFNELQLVALKCDVFSFNKAALVMHKRFGYQKIGCFSHVKGEVQVLELKK